MAKLGPMTDPHVYPSLTQKAWFLTGATASGKSAVGVCLAQQLDAEIVSLDSMTVYRRMDLGTAKPSPEQRRTVPHHLFDLVQPDQSFSVAEYLDQAHVCVDQIIQRARQPLFVGGTPMYLKACLRGLDVGPPANWEFRKAIQEELREHGPEELHRRLQQVDPLAAHQLHPNDTRRLTRALEVAKFTGQPLSHRQIQFESYFQASQVHVYALRLPRAQLHERIHQRVERMFAQGLVDEVAALAKDFPDLSRTARQAVGYKEVLQHLDGELTIQQTIEQVKAHTRQLARRQETWLRSLPEAQFVEIDAQQDATDIVQQILALAKAKTSDGEH